MDEPSGTFPATGNALYPSGSDCHSAALSAPAHTNHVETRADPRTMGSSYADAGGDGCMMTRSEIAGYRLVRKLGAGGQGEVWEAIHLASNAKLAIKISAPGLLSSAQARARFVQSFQTLALLNHPYIVKGLDHGLLPSGEAWHAMEYVSGYTLTEYVERLDAAELRQTGGRRRTHFPLPAVLALFARVCEAVEAAHRVGVIHRDLKPSNILVDDSGAPRLLDFGLARLPEAPSATLLTITGQFIGSPAWASPEQVEGRPERIDVRSDVYALGVVLYHILTGTYPYDVEGPLARTFDQILHAEPVPPRDHAKFIDADLQAIMLKTLAKQRERRYQTVAELRADLERYLAGQPVLAKGDSLAYVAWKLAQRHRVIAAAAALLLLITGIYAGTMTLLYRRATHAEAEARTAAAKATQQFGVARDTAEFLLDEVDQKLENVAGAGALRRSLLEQSYDRFEGFLTEHSDDPRVQAEAARWLLKLSEVAYKLGRLDDAEAKRRAAWEIHERLLAADPDNADLQAALSINLVLLGDIAKRRGDRDSFRELYQQALRIDEELVERFPSNDRYADNLGYSYERVAFHVRDINDAEGRLALLLRRHLLTERLAAEHPEDLMRRYGLVTSLHDLTNEYMEKRDLATAEAYLTRNVDLAASLVAAEPANVHYRLYWVYVLKQQAKYARLLGDDALADSFMDQAIQETEQVLAVEPSQPPYREAIVGVRRDQGLEAAVAGDWPECARRFGEEFDLLIRLLQDDPASEDIQSRICWSTHAVAFMRVACGVSCSPDAAACLPEEAQPAVATCASPSSRLGQWTRILADHCAPDDGPPMPVPDEINAELMALVERGLSALPDTESSRLCREGAENLLGFGTPPAMAGPSSSTVP